ncbi:MAG: LysR family transcriptional regulator [Lachnospiraceae bacterium]|nr:LysR family transcriptional regulator [Lachnospiraceae bacterium]
MNFLNLKYFIAIAEEKNISAAARNLYVSQQSLSEHLKKLENEVGVPLFHRGTELTLTVAGECFLEGSREILASYDRMIANISAVTEQRRSQITIAVATYGDPPFLADLILRFTQKYPLYDVSVIKRLHTDVSYHMLGADLYISYLPVDESLAVVPVLEEDPYCVLLHRSVAAAAFGSDWEAAEAELIATQNLALLKRLPFILLNDRHGRLANDLDLIFKEYRFAPLAGFQSENGDLNAQMCERGAGCLLAPGDYIRRRFGNADGVLPSDLLCFPIQTESFPARLAICYEKGKHLHDAEICFINEMKAYFSESISSV